MYRRAGHMHHHPGVFVPPNTRVYMPQSRPGEQWSLPHYSPPTGPLPQPHTCVQRPSNNNTTADRFSRRRDVSFSGPGGSIRITPAQSSSEPTMDHPRAPLGGSLRVTSVPTQPSIGPTAQHLQAPPGFPTAAQIVGGPPNGPLLHTATTANTSRRVNIFMDRNREDSNGNHAGTPDISANQQGYGPAREPVQQFSESLVRERGRPTMSNYPVFKQVRHTRLLRTPTFTLASTQHS